MNIIHLDYDQHFHRHYMELSLSGNSDAIAMPIKFSNVTVLLSSVSGGTAKIEYSLSVTSRVDDDSAIWHEWANGDASSTEEKGTSFDSPVTYIRAIADSGVSYIVEVLT